MRKKIMSVICAAQCFASVYAFGADRGKNSAFERTPPAKITLTARGEVLIVALRDNSSARALTELLQRGALTIKMKDIGGFEKSGEFSASLPQNDEPQNKNAGDLILLGGRTFIICYDKKSQVFTPSWSFTTLGKIKKLTQNELKNAFGKRNVTVTLKNAD
ncbi:MAG: cyclophilin-like fold protein [Treponema sp.]